MDVKQPGKNGFEVVAAVQHRPAVIVTSMAAHDAAKAFEFQAIGYLIKALTSERISLALQRFDRWNGMSGKICRAHNVRGCYPAHILVEKGRRLTSIAVSEITHLKADKDYTWAHMLNGTFYLSTTGIG